MWARNDWLPKAAGLQPGKRLRTQCNCGTGRTLLLSRDSRGYHAHCFREGETDWAPGPQESLADKMARVRQQLAGDDAIRRLVDLPSGGLADPSEWPPAAYLWFLKAGLGRREIGELGATYNPGSGRVILPVYETPVTDGSKRTVSFWQGRSVDGRQPKYLAPDVDRSRVIPRYGTAQSVTLTEDILSAYKVGLDHEGWSMLGTKLSDYSLGELLKRHQEQPSFTVNVWLDNDLPPLHQINRGQIAARKVLAKLRAVGIPARNVISTRDPKLMSRAQIKELLHVLPV